MRTLDEAAVRKLVMQAIEDAHDNIVVAETKITANIVSTAERVPQNSSHYTRLWPQEPR